MMTSTDINTRLETKEKANATIKDVEKTIEKSNSMRFYMTFRYDIQIALFVFPSLSNTDEHTNELILL